MTKGNNEQLVSLASVATFLLGKNFVFSFGSPLLARERPW